MELIQEKEYSINFYIIESNDPKSIVIFDKSLYIDLPEKPLLEVTLPGFTGSVQIPYLPNTLIVLNSDSLDLTKECEYENYADLPDGVYQITMKFCPYETFYNKKCFLKTSNFYQEYQKLLLSLDFTKDSYDQDYIKNQIINMDILIQSAKAETSLCNIQKAVNKYSGALSILSNINRKINCI